MTYSIQLLRWRSTLNVYQINLFQHLCFMYNFNKNETPVVFNFFFKNLFISIQQIFQKITLASKVSFSMVHEEKEINSYALFSRAIKSKLIETDEERKYF